jgi:hypothetical protein
MEGVKGKKMKCVMPFTCFMIARLQAFLHAVRSLLFDDPQHLCQYPLNAMKKVYSFFFTSFIPLSVYDLT